MSSTSITVPASEELETSFKNSLSPSSKVIGFQISINKDNEKFELAKETERVVSNSIGEDFQHLCSFATEDSGNYFLFKLAAKEWIIITYVPEKVSGKEKMLFASAKSSIKDIFDPNHQLITQEFHFSAKNELTYSNLQSSQKPVDSRSEFEKIHEKILKQEETVREEQMEQLSLKEKSNSGGSGIGGYHSVNIPFDEKSKTEIAKLKTEQYNFIELFINSTQDKIECANAKEVADNNISKELNTSEPRFYLFKLFKNSSSIGAKSTVFIYCCPEKSPPKLRMVYSTSKPGIADQVSKLGISLTKKIEVTDPSEVTIKYLQDSINTNMNAGGSKPTYGSNVGSNVGAKARSFNSGLPEGGGTTKAKNQSVVQQPHPLMKMMNSNSNMEGSTTKKKIVIPPPSAW